MNNKSNILNPKTLCLSFITDQFLREVIIVFAKKKCPSLILHNESLYT